MVGAIKKPNEITNSVFFLNSIAHDINSTVQIDRLIIYASLYAVYLQKILISPQFHIHHSSSHFCRLKKWGALIKT